MVEMAKAHKSSPVASALGAGVAAIVFIYALALAVGFIELPQANNLIETTGQVSSRQIVLDPPPVGKQYQRPMQRNFLGYSFVDNIGVTRTGQVEVSVVQYERYAVGDELTLVYAPTDPTAVSIDRPADKAPAWLHLSAFLLLFAGLAELVFIDRLAKALGSRGYL